MKRVYVDWLDASGGTLLQYWAFLSAGTAAALLATIAGHSNAGVVDHTEGAVTSVVPAPAAATFQTVQDLAKLAFCTPAGVTVPLVIPAPKSGIFFADQQSVNDAAIADVIAAALGTLCDSNGVAVTTYAGGIRISRGRVQT